MKTAAKMAAHSLPHLMMAKQAVNDAYEVGLLQGLQGTVTYVVYMCVCCVCVYNDAYEVGLLQGLQGTGVHSYIYSIYLCVLCVYICVCIDR